MGLKISAKSRVDDVIEELFKNGIVIVENGAMSRMVARSLGPVRKRKRLVVARDPELKLSVLMFLGQVERKQRVRRGFGGSVFDLILY